MQQDRASTLIFGVFLLLGLSTLGYLLGNAAIRYKLYDRTVTVKGLSEREYKADVVIWPIQFTATANDLESLYEQIEQNALKIKTFLTNHGIPSKEVTLPSPLITDKSAQQYDSSVKPEFRYTATQTVTVYSHNIPTVRAAMSALSSLGKQGIAFSGDYYSSRTEYLFTRLNEVKPAMIEEATKKAREVAEKFASDSKSKLGKIKRATQGQFSIYPRDQNTPYIKKVRVVSTIQYYLTD